MAVKTRTQGANAPRSVRPRQRLFWSRLHFAIRLLGLTGALLACVGAVLASLKHELDSLTDAKTIQDAYTVGLNLAQTAIDNPERDWRTLLLFGGAAIALFALLVEAIVVLCFTATRRSAFGFNALLQGALAAILLLAVNAWSFRHYVLVDFTRDHQFTLPAEVRDNLRQLDPDSKTTIIVYQRHKAFGRLSEKPDGNDKPPDEYDKAAERKVIEKVKDLADLLREVGPKVAVEVLDVESRNYKTQLASLTEGAPELKKAIEAAPENSLFFYAKGASDKPYLQRLSFNDFYLLDKTASQEDRNGRGNLVLLYQGAEPFASRLLHLEEKRPRIGIAVIHKVLTTTSEHDWGLQGLRRALESRGFAVEDIVLKKWSRFAPPTAAAATVDESALERLEDRQGAIEQLIANLDRQRPVIVKSLELWKKAIDDEKTRADLTRRLADQLDGNKVTEELARLQTAVLQANLENIDRAMPVYRQRLAEVREEKSKLNVPALNEQRRMTDVKAKMERLLADCDLLIVPRMTLRNTADDYENIPSRVYRLDEAQVDAIKDFLKGGKPVLACLGPTNTPREGMAQPEDLQPDALEDLLTQLGVHLGKQTVLFDDEVEALAESRTGAEIGGVQFEPPPVLFDWTPGAGRPIGSPPPSDKTNRIRESLQLTARALGKDAEGKPVPLDIRIRHPRPIYFVPPRGSKVASDPDFLMTNPRSWNEDQPFPTADSVPQFERANKGRDKEAGMLETSKDPLEARRRGPFPIGVAVETQLPSSWYASAADKPASVRLAVIGQGGFFTGKKLAPAQERLFVNTIDWLLGRDDQLPRDDRVWSYPRVNDTIPPDSETEYLWLWGVRLGLPVLFAFSGLVVLLFRRLR